MAIMALCRVSSHRDLMRLLVLLAVVHAVVQLVTPLPRPPPASRQATGRGRSGDLENGRARSLADHVRPRGGASQLLGQWTPAPVPADLGVAGARQERGAVGTEVPTGGVVTVETCQIPDL